MSPSVRRIWLAILTIVVAILVLRTLIKSSDSSQQTNPGDDPASTTIHATDISTRRVPVRDRARGDRPETSRPQHRTTGVIELPSTPVNLTPPVSGFMVDLFSPWTAIPPGYVADGVTLSNGAITLSDVQGTTGPRDGVLISPALPLRQPAMAGPVLQNMQLPEGSSVQLQISLSEEGTAWSPWLMVNRYVPPEGKRIAPVMQPMLANADLPMLDSQSSGSEDTQMTPGPAIRYRLGLSASDEAPVVTDIRIWKRETP